MADEYKTCAARIAGLEREVRQLQQDKERLKTENARLRASLQRYEEPRAEPAPSQKCPGCGCTCEGPFTPAGDTHWEWLCPNDHCDVDGFRRGKGWEDRAGNVVAPAGEAP